MHGVARSVQDRYKSCGVLGPVRTARQITDFWLSFVKAFTRAFHGVVWLLLLVLAGTLNAFLGDLGVQKPAVEK